MVERLRPSYHSTNVRRNDAARLFAVASASQLKERERIYQQQNRCSHGLQVINAHVASTLVPALNSIDALSKPLSAVQECHKRSSIPKARYIIPDARYALRSPRMKSARLVVFQSCPPPLQQCRPPSYRSSRQWRVTVTAGRHMIGTETKMLRITAVALPSLNESKTPARPARAHGMTIMSAPIRRRRRVPTLPLRKYSPIGIITRKSRPGCGLSQLTRPRAIIRVAPAAEMPPRTRIGIASTRLDLIGTPPYKCQQMRRPRRRVKTLMSQSTSSSEPH